MEAALKAVLNRWHTKASTGRRWLIQTVSLATVLHAGIPVCVNATTYLIETVDGKVIETSRYWQEGGEIRFNRYGGTVGISRQAVRKIREIAGSVQSGSRENTDPPTTPEIHAPEQPETRAKTSTALPTSQGNVDQAFSAAVLVFSEKARGMNSMSKAELLGLAEEGVKLKTQRLTSGQPYYEDPALIKLYALLDEIQQAIHRKP